MKVTVIGTGYVGLVTGACLAEVGHDVICMDVDEAKIRTLKSGQIPIHEPGLQEIVQRNVDHGRLGFTSDPENAVAHGTVQFIAVGTPPAEDGSADSKHVLAAARSIGRLMTSRKVVVNKSTVPVGSADKVRAAITEELERRAADLPFSVVSNPEFLKEGAAVDDFMRPDRIIVGAEDPYAIRVMRTLYEPFRNGHDVLIVMDTRSAELTKYAANAMLATRISFMNELALLAEQLDADIEQVRFGIGADPRIGEQFLHAGCGYGGSCFPKDVKALLQSGRELGRDLALLSAVEATNEVQKRVLVEKVRKRFGNDLKGRRFAVWGLAFKPNTDDMREAPSRVIIPALIEHGAKVIAYDPVAMNEARKVFGDLAGLSYVEKPMHALEGADALLLITEWKEFRSPDFETVKNRLKSPVIFDGRNIYAPETMREMGFEYLGIGRPILNRLSSERSDERR